jgi:SpoVK/Ycf46/Vps4 family AAA+-type ATPase
MQMKPVTTWKQLAIPRDSLNALRTICSRAKDEGLTGRNHAPGKGLAILFAGSDVANKMLAAEIIARELVRDLRRIDLSAVVSKYIGETEKNLGKLFDTAERSGVILFLDEADALFGKRSEVKDSHDRYANIEINYLMRRVEAYCGLAIVATNMKNSLDGAFLRRFKFIVEFPLPDSNCQ